MISLRRAAAVLTSVGLLALLPAFARNAALAGAEPEPAKSAPDDKDAASRFHPAAGSAIDAKLDAAHDYIRDAEWDKAVRVLQQMLDLNEDRMAEVGGDKHPRIVSVHAEAERLIAGLPADGKKAYQAAQGPAAADLLTEGVKEKDEKKIAGVVRRFLNTDAGPDALEALAGLHYDAGRYRLAAFSYTRLLGLRDAPKWTPETLFHAWDAFRRTGDKDHADLVGTQLLKSAGAEGVRIGDKNYSRDDLEKEMARPLVEANGDWPMFGGDAGRSARAEGGMPFLRYDWAAPTTVSNSSPPLEFVNFGAKAAALFKSAADKLTDVKQPVLPPMFPVTATVTLARDGKKHSLAVFRIHSGIAACDMAGGKLVGRASIKGSLDWMMSDPAREAALNPWTQQDIQRGERPGILFENTTIGALSSEGDLVYTVEDLAVPPPASFSIPGNPGHPNPWGWSRDVLDAVGHSRLLAFDVAAGCKTVWELPALGDTKSELADSYFLGSPLPLDGRLFVLNEKDNELRLVGLETIKEKKGDYSARLSFVLPLGTVHAGLRDDPLRRVHAALPAYGDGVLVCPTNAGCVVGVDLLTHTLAWVHQYEEPKVAPAPAGRPAPGFLPPGGLPAAAAPSEWRNPAPIVCDGAVIVATPDSDSLSCLDLKTGDLRWKDARQDGDLYVAGAFDGRVLVVGKKACRAYNLSDGKLLWTLKVGLPSGQGAAAGGVYYLPLREAIASKEPEICGIDLAKGKVVARATGRSREEVGKVDAPGNLLFSEGVLVSQTTTEVAAYPLLKTKLEQMDAALAKTPNDSDGLFRRAELRLENGNLLAAVEDLRTVIDAKPPQELLGKARWVLYDGLTQLLQSDFDKGEKYLKEYEELCKGGADDAEARRRRANFFLLSGRGYEGQGRLLDALKAYEELGGFGDDTLESPDDPALQVSPAVWAKARITDLLRKATPEQRKQLQEEIDRRFKDAKDSADAGDLRAFVALFGPSTAAGRDARLELAERLIAKPSSDREAEVLLVSLAQQKDDAVTAARAVEALARLSVRLGLLEDALYYYGVLNRDYPTTKVREGKAGADFYKDMAADKRFLPYLGDRPQPFEGGHLQATEERGDFAPATASFHFTHQGEPLPFFRGSSLSLQFDKHELHLVDRATGEPRWKPIPLTQTMFRTILAGDERQAPPIALPGKPVVNIQPPPAPEFSFLSLGRLAVVPLGHMVFCVDAVAGKLLWEKDLSRPADRPVAGPPAYLSASHDPRGDDVLLTYGDGWVQHVGPGAVVLTPSALYVMTREGLTAFDPPTGRTLWRRDDVAADCRIFGDDEGVCVVEYANRAVARTRAFRADCGSPVRTPGFRAAFETRLRIVGRNLLTADSSKDGLTLRLYDPLAGKDLWTETYPTGSIALNSLAGDLTRAVDPSGKVHIVDLNLRKEIASAAVDPKYVDGVASVYLLADGKSFYIACDAPLSANTFLKSDLAPGTGLRDLPVNGEVCAFDAATGKMKWHLGAATQRLLLDEFAETPVVVLAARKTKLAPFGGEERTAVRMVEKRTGKLVWDADEFKGDVFQAIDVDAAKGRVEFVAPQAKITITVLEK